MTVDGIDISAWQATSTDDRTMDGCEFVGIRATYGTSKDASYDAHEANARRHGCVVLAYCFGRNGDGARQADALLSAAPHADLYVLDLERDGSLPSMTASQASAFLAHANAATPKRVGLYHSESGFPSGLGEQFRWVAKWGKVPPSGPWAFWQWQGSPLDRDLFNGTLAQLRAMAGIAPAPTAPLYKVVIDGNSHDKVTDVSASPNGAKVGELYRATVVARQSRVSGVWWYQISAAGGDAARYVGKWFPAHSWMTATPVKETP